RPIVLLKRTGSAGCRCALRLEEPALADQVQEVLQFLWRQRFTEPLREGRGEISCGPCAIESGQQEMLLGPELERLAFAADAAEVGAIRPEGLGDQLPSPAGKWLGGVGHGNPSEGLAERAPPWVGSQS